MLTLALCVLGVGSVNATKLYANLSANVGTEGETNVWWIASTHTLGWKLSYSNSFELQGLSGDLSDYETITINASGYTGGNEYRLIFYGPNFDGGQKILGPFYSNGGTYNLAERGFTKQMLSNISSINLAGGSGSGSIVIERVYLQKPMSINIDDMGNATISITDLSASGCLSLDEQTGVLTNHKGEEGAATWGRMTINFPEGGVDLTYLKAFSINYTGTNVFGNFEIGSKGFWSKVTGRDDLANYMSDPAIGDASKVTNWIWNANDEASSMTISSITLRFSTLAASNPHETPLTTDMYVGTPESHFGETMGQGATIYGMGANIDGSQYVDLAAYDEMHIYGTSGKSIRLLFNYDQSAPTKTDVTGNLDGNGFYSLDLSTLGAQKLNAFKFPWDGQSGIITKVVLFKNSIPVNYSYVLSGAGAMTPSVEAALADANATSYDATGLIGTGVTLTPTNPNALFKANAGALANTQNVIVDGTCANLVLSDGHPFKAPANFTATAASYSTTINDEAKAGTLCLPFTATIPEGVEAYTLTYTSGATVTAAKIDGTIPANTPVLLNGEGDVTFTGVGAVSATATNAGGALTGVFEKTPVPVNSFVLQNGSEGVGFYKVASTAIYANPFRAYLTAQAEARCLNIVFADEEEEVTGIKAIETVKADKKIFNLNGQRMAQPKKGLNIIGGKKVLK